jgi:hypothetical protein
MAQRKASIIFIKIKIFEPYKFSHRGFKLNVHLEIDNTEIWAPSLKTEDLITCCLVRFTAREGGGG